MKPLPSFVMWDQNRLQVQVLHYHGLNPVSHWVQLKDISLVNEMPVHTRILYKSDPETIKHVTNSYKYTNTYWMINIKESLACGQLVRLFDLLKSSYSQEHADWRTQGKEIHRLKVQSVVDDRHLQKVY